MANRLTGARVCMAVLAAGAALAGAAAPARAQNPYELVDGNWIAVAAPAKGTPAGELELIRQYVDKGWGRTACRAVDSFLKKYPADPTAEEVMNLGGQAEMVRGRYFQAFERFNDQILRFPGGPYVERALQRELEIGEAFLAGKKRIVWGIFYLSAERDGIDILNKIVDHAPGSTLAEKGLLRIADYHYQEREYPEAVRAYDRYLEVFGRGEKASYAMLQAARASYANFRGIEFEDTPLLEATQRYRMFAERFPLQADRANVPRILEGIRVTLARKMYATGQFYERVHKPAPAKFYYRLTAEQYPQTEWETKAAAALRRLGEPLPAPGAGGPTVPVVPATMPASAPATLPATAPATAPTTAPSVTP